MPRVSIPAFCLMVVTTLAGSRSRDPQAVETRPDAPFTAVVSASGARLFFPLEDRREWIWYLSTTPDNEREYEWSGEVENGGTRYQFGFFLFKPQGTTTARGGFRALLPPGPTSAPAAAGTAPPRRKNGAAEGSGRTA